MKKNHNKYPTVDTLPKGAMTVREYATRNEVTTSYIYKLIKEEKAKFQMVVFQSINFIIPEN